MVRLEDDACRGVGKGAGVVAEDGGGGPPWWIFVLLPVFVVGGGLAAWYGPKLRARWAAGAARVAAEQAAEAAGAAEATNSPTPTREVKRILGPQGARRSSKGRDESATRRLRELDDDDFSVVSVGGAARAMGCRESDFRVDDDDMSMVSSASRSGRKVKRKSERRALVDKLKGAPKTYGKRAAPASRSKGEGFYEL